MKIKFIIALSAILILNILKINAKENDSGSSFMNPTIKTIHQRKSVRSFTDEKVSKEVLEQLIKAGMAAPTAVNKQPWAFVAIDDVKILAQLREQLPYAKMIKKAAIVVCGNLQKTLPNEGQAFWIQDCSAASENILLAVESMGLGAVWTAVYPEKDRMEAVTKILELPEYIIPLNVIPIGYPATENQPKDKWKPENLHWQKW